MNSINSSLRARVRDVLPLPVASESAPFSSLSDAGGCRKTQRKHQRLHHETEWADQCVKALNSCWGRGTGIDSATLRPDGVSTVLDNIKEAVVRMGKPPPDMTPEGAYRKLLGGSSTYAEVRPDLASFSLELVSWPEVGGEHCQVVDLLPDGDSMRLSNWRDSMLRSSTESLELQRELGVSQPYCDPELLRSPQVYGRFLQEMHARGLVDFEESGGRAASLGIFFVKKKDGKQRIIFDTRLINCDFVSPETVSLPTAGSLGGVEVDPEETLYVATCDVSTAFYRMLVPLSLCASVSRCPPLRADTWELLQVAFVEHSRLASPFCLWGGRGHCASASSSWRVLCRLRWAQRIQSRMGSHSLVWRQGSQREQPMSTMFWSLPHARRWLMSLSSGLPSR